MLPAYNADFVAKLRALHRPLEASQHTLTRAASGTPTAELEVDLTHLDGRGVEPDPMAEMQFACEPIKMASFYVDKVAIHGSLGLAGTGAAVFRCPFEE